MLLSMGSVFAEDASANEILPRIPIYQATFPGSQNFFDQTSDIFIQPYGSPVGKTIGSVTLSGWVAWSGLVQR